MRTETMREMALSASFCLARDLAAECNMSPSPGLWQDTEPERNATAGEGGQITIARERVCHRQSV